MLGFDGLSLGELIEPALTSLRIDKPEVGRLAVEQIGRMLDGKPPLRDEAAWIRPELVVRAST